MAKKKNPPPVPIIKIKKGESLKSIYAKLHESFTAADLQKYTVAEEGIPAKDVLADMEALDRETAKKKRELKKKEKEKNEQKKKAMNEQKKKEQKKGNPKNDRSR